MRGWQKVWKEDPERPPSQGGAHCFVEPSVYSLNVGPLGFFENR